MSSQSFSSTQFRMKVFASLLVFATSSALLAIPGCSEDSQGTGGTGGTDGAISGRVIVPPNHVLEVEPNDSPDAAQAIGQASRVSGEADANDPGFELPADVASHKPLGRPQIPRERIVRRALEMLEKRDREHIAVPDLASSVGVSERTLRRAFNEYYGIGPVGYLQLRKLHQVRGTLQAAKFDETTVASVLFGYGVWELGRFASRYRRQFGESPYETLRAKRC